jgi:hypothetical protein
MFGPIWRKRRAASGCFRHPATWNVGTAVPGGLGGSRTPRQAVRHSMTGAQRHIAPAWTCSPPTWCCLGGRADYNAAKLPGCLGCLPVVRSSRHFAHCALPSPMLPLAGGWFLVQVRFHAHLVGLEPSPASVASSRRRMDYFGMKRAALGDEASLCKGRRRSTSLGQGRCRARMGKVTLQARIQQRRRHRQRHRKGGHGTR